MSTDNPLDPPDSYTIADACVHLIMTVFAIGLALILSDAFFGPENVTNWLASLIR